jgi:uncharacterized membrane protein (DUF4010 family)
MIIFLLGVLVGRGHLFTPVACVILVAMLLSLKPAEVSLTRLESASTLGISQFA